MSLRKFSIIYDRIIYGPYPQEELNDIPNVTVEVEKISIARDKVTFTIDNNKEEDFYAIVYEIGCLAQSYLDLRAMSKQ